MDILSKFSDPLLNIGPKLPSLIMSLAFGWLVIKILSGLLKNTLRIAKVPRALASITMSLALVVMWVILFSELTREAGLSSLAVKISSTLLVLALAVANGATLIAGDILSGIFLAKDPDYDVGYWIKTCDIEGRIEKIDVRKTRIRDKDGCLHVIPNSKLDSSGWRVIDRNPNENGNQQ